jgi:hypothetical protein
MCCQSFRYSGSVTQETTRQSTTSQTSPHFPTPTPTLNLPEDPFIPAAYTAATCAEGKAAARSELRRRLNLSHQEDRLIVAVVSRLTGQTGVHLIKHAAWRARERGGQFVLLGSAPDPKVQEEFNALSQELGGGHDNNAAFAFYYDGGLGGSVGEGVCGGVGALPCSWRFSQKEREETVGALRTQLKTSSSTLHPTPTPHHTQSRCPT